MKVLRLLLAGFILSLFFLLGFVSRVSAEGEPSSTPTPSLEPLFPTRTPKPPSYIVCPTGNPSGWGTVTPDQAWLNTCRRCITQTPLADWGPTPTPYFSPTPRFCYYATNVYKTMVATYPAIAYDHTPAVLTPVGIYCDWCGGCPTSTSVPTITPTLKAKCNITITAQSNSYYTVSSNDGKTLLITWKWQAPWADWANVETWLDIGSGIGTVKGTIVDVKRFPYYEWGYGPYAGNLTASNEVFNNAIYKGFYNVALGDSRTITLGGSNQILKHGYPAHSVARAAYKGAYHEWTMKLEGVDCDLDVSGYVSATVTPVVSVTPAGVGTPDPDTCAAVDPKVDLNIGEIIPYPLVGPKECISIGPVEISMPSWLLSQGEQYSVDFPQLSICVRELYLGKIDIFGVEVGLDAFAGLLIGIAAIRFVLRS